MKKIMFTSVIVAVLLAVCIVPGVSQEFEFPSKGQLNFIKSEKKWLVPMAKDKKAFVEAVKEGNIAKVKKIMSDFPAFNFLDFDIPFQCEICMEPTDITPACVAAIYGHTELLKFLIRMDKSRIYQYCPWGLLFDAAIRKKHLDTAEALLAFDDKGYFTDDLKLIAEYFKDETVLKRIIPLVLANGEVYNKIVLSMESGFGLEAFYKAAELKNVNFIIVLKDELKKRGIDKPVAKCIREFSDYETPEMIKQNVMNSEAGLLLKRYGIDIYVGA